MKEEKKWEKGKMLVYTFRTFPYQNELRKEFDDLFILGKLKEDLQRFFKLIREEKPILIMGVALADSKQSFFEPRTINKFHRIGKVTREGKEEFLLFVPDLQNKIFKISRNPSSTFCNYSMYKIKFFLEQEKLAVPLAVTHIKREDIKRLKETLLRNNLTRTRELLCSTV